MTMKKNGKRCFKLNKNKKGFSLVELLCAVAIIAIMTPILVNGFTHAAKLNYRARLQQRVDEKANYIYEGIASVEYEELAAYLSESNGWYAADQSQGYEYYVTNKNPSSSEQNDWDISIAVKKYSAPYIVPDLNLIGENSQYLTLSDAIYVDDNFVEQRMKQEVRNSNTIKGLIADKILEKYSSLGSIDKNRITINLVDTIDSSKISKRTNLTLSIDSEKNINAGYDVSYVYPATSASDTTSTFSVSYSYTYRDGGSWKKIEGADAIIDGLTQVTLSVKEGSVSFPAELTDGTVNQTTPQKIFVYYTPYSKLDYIDIKNNETMPFNVYMIEQGDVTSSNITLDSYKYDDSPSIENNGVKLVNGGRYIYLYSNNLKVCPGGIPDDVYQSGDHQENMYRISVSVSYQTSLFANVSGSFKMGEELIIPQS